MRGRVNSGNWVFRLHPNAHFADTKCDFLRTNRRALRLPQDFTNCVPDRHLLTLVSIKQGRVWHFLFRDSFGNEIQPGFEALNKRSQCLTFFINVSHSVVCPR